MHGDEYRAQHQAKWFNRKKVYRMDSKFIPQANQVVDCTDNLAKIDIPSIIKGLSNPDNTVRLEMRNVLSCIGAPAVPELLKTMANADTNLRWQIIKVFDSIRDLSTIPILMEQLKDDDSEIRWAASNALLNLRRAALPALFDALTRDFSSMNLRQSAHHILRILRDNGKLTPIEVKVYEALGDIEPTVSVPWAAAKALQAIRDKNNNLLR
jgi:HEAT repeat protein